LRISADSIGEVKIAAAIELVGPQPRPFGNRHGKICRVQQTVICIGHAARSRERKSMAGQGMSSHIARKVVASFQKISTPTKDCEKLSLREQQVIDWLAQGHAY